MPTPFESFVNNELPKRPFTNDVPTSWEAGKPLVATGVGLGTTTGEFPSVPVTSVNGGTGAVVLSATDVGAVPSSDVGSTVCELSGGLVPTNRIPAIAIVQFLGTVASQAAMLALNGQQGDWCIRSDTSMVYILVDSNPALLSSWQALSYPAAPVTTVNGQAGAVVLGYSDVGADAAGAAATAQAVAIAYSVQRGNHTGTQLASTISDFASAAAAVAPVISVNARTGAVTALEAIIENIGKQAFVGTDCLEEYSKSQFTVTASNATISNATSVTGMADAVGVWKWAGSGAGDIACAVSLTSGFGVANVKLSSEPVVLISSFAKTSLLTRERVTTGAYVTDLNGNTSFGGDVNNGFCISLDDNTALSGGGEWNFRTVSGAVVTSTGTVGAPVADDTRYTCVIIATSSSIKYYVNGTLYATHTTNIPTVALKLGVGMYQVAGGAFQGGNFYLDMFHAGRVYKTTPRSLGLPSITY